MMFAGVSLVATCSSSLVLAVARLCAFHAVRSIKTMAVSLLNNTYVAPRAREVSFSTWLRRKAARFEGIAVVPRKACSSLIDWQRSFLLAVRAEAALVRTTHRQSPRFSRPVIILRL